MARYLTGIHRNRNRTRPNQLRHPHSQRHRNNKYRNQQLRIPRMGFSSPPPHRYRAQQQVGFASARSFSIALTHQRNR